MNEPEIATDPLFWYPYEPAKFDEGTSDFTLAEVGAYQRLLNYQWSKKGRGVPGDNMQALSRILRCTPSTARSIWQSIGEKFVQQPDGKWLNEKLERVRARQERRKVVAKENGSLGGRPKTKEQSESKPTGKPNGKPNGKQNPNLNETYSEKETRDLPKEREDLPPVAPQGALRQRFETWWAAYPKHRRVAKTAAWRVWERLRPNAELLEHMLAVLRVQVQSHDWSKEHGKFVPHPRTYLNRGQWEDEVAGEVATGQAMPFWDECAKCGGIHPVGEPCPPEGAS